MHEFLDWVAIVVAALFVWLVLIALPLGFLLGKVAKVAKPFRGPEKRLVSQVEAYLIAEAQK